jgi:hypothetical protein
LVLKKTMSNVYTKLNQARIALQRGELKKSGRNKFAGYNYFELGDFLPTVQNIFATVGLCGIVSYSSEEAVLSIYDCDKPEDVIRILSPMSSAALKGAHEIQNLGAVQTYLRRYLWVTAMEIVEHDQLDAVLGATKDSVKPAPVAEQKPKGRERGYVPGDSVAPADQDPLWRLLEIKLHDMGLTPFGAKTVLVLCNAESFEEIAEAKAKQVYEAVNPQMVSQFNAGKNSKGSQILTPPIVDKARNNSVEELERAAAALFDDDEK